MAQLFIAAGCVAAAIAYLGWRAWRTWRPAPGSACGGECGCAKEKPKPAPPRRVALGMERLEGRNPAG